MSRASASESSSEVSVENERKKIRKALKEIRREGYKASFIYAVVDSSLVLMATNLLLALFEISQIPDSVTVPIPSSVLSLMNSAFASIGASPVESPIEPSGGALVTLGVGVVVFVVSFAYRAYVYSEVEKFESVNPEIEEALRTARDIAKKEDDENPVAVALYDDVVERLRSTSSAGLLSNRRIFVSILLIFGMAIGAFYMTYSDQPALNSPSGILGSDSSTSQSSGGGGGGGAGGGQGGSGYQGLQSGDSVLGEAEDVSSGSQNLDASLQRGGGGSGSGGGASPEEYDSSGYSGNGGGVESQQAGFEEQQKIDDADLVKDYNVRIRSGSDNNG